MFKKLLTLLIFLSASVVYASPIEVTPVKKISTTTKKFTVGKKYDFKDTKTGEIYQGEVTYYRPNGFTGQEAQIEISNFKDKDGNSIEGKITVVPSNHKNFQEYTNYFGNCTIWVRGSEVILRPKKNKFLINVKNETSKSYLINLIPANPISTTHDELEIGDIIEFKTTADVYKNGKLFIKSGTPVFGTIDYLDENGWVADNAVIYIKNFKTKTADNKDLIIKSELTINGFELLKYKSKRTAQFFNYTSTLVRGKEIDIKPCDKNVNFVITVEE